MSISPRLMMCFNLPPRYFWVIEDELLSPRVLYNIILYTTGHLNVSTAPHWVRERCRCHNCKRLQYICQVFFQMNRHLERRLPVSGVERCPACHPERELWISAAVSLDPSLRSGWQAVSPNVYRINFTNLSKIALNPPGTKCSVSKYKIDYNSSSIYSKNLVYSS